jgi:hypothetical protein
MRLVLRAGFDRFSGYGNDAVDIAVNLARLGVQVTPWPTGVMPGLPRAFTRLLERDPTGPKDVLLAFSDPVAMRPWEFAGLAPRTVGYSMWERTPLRRADLPWGRRARRWSAHGLDGMAVSCEMNIGAFRALDPQLPMLVVPGGIEPSEWPELMAGNPGLNAELVVHTFTPGVHPAAADYYGPKIRMSQRALSRPELVALYRSCDVLVSASRGEGNNKPALEFQATGGTAIVPDWGGHRNWLHEAATGLPGELVPAMDAPGAVEFAVDHDELVKALWRHASDPVWVADRGQRCASAVRARMSWRRTLRPLVDWLAAS